MEGQGLALKLEWKLAGSNLGMMQYYAIVAGPREELASNVVHIVM